jgi:hypothetical protein
VKAGKQKNEAGDNHPRGITGTFQGAAYASLCSDVRLHLECVRKYFRVSLQGKN